MDKSEPKFEIAMKRLNEIVDDLESGDLSLEESLKLYEEGVKTSQKCMKRLQEAQSRIKMLMRNSSGDLETQDFTTATEKPKKKKKK
jgi:exodeoxyribonuclease VII small subunit